MTPRTLLLCALLSLAAPALGSDLSGLYWVEGNLTNGDGLKGVAALSPEPEVPGGYRLTARAKLGHRSISWRARLTPEGDGLLSRHIGDSGIGHRLSVRRRPPPVLGRYKIAGDRRAFAGRFHLEGKARGGELRFERAPDPKVTFDPPRLWLRQGQEAWVRVQVEPRVALTFLGIEGGEVLPSRQVDGGKRVRVRPKAPGKHPLLVRLGSGSAAPLATLEVRVARSWADEVIRRVERARAEAKVAYILLDVDGGLIDPRHRQRGILAQVGAEVGDARLTDMDLDQIQPTLADTLAAAGLTPDEVQGPLGVKVGKAWTERAFTAEGLRLDRAWRGAVDAVVKATDAGARVVYFADRPEEARPPSREVLVEAGFPTGTVHMVGRGHDAGARKVPMVRALLGKGAAIVAAVANHPRHAAVLRALCPDAFVAWAVVGEEHPADPPPKVELLRRW